VKKGWKTMDSTTVQLFGGCIAAIVPLLFISVMIKDRNSRRIVLYFCWGVFAGVLSYIINNSLAAAPGYAERVTTSIAPVVEEVCKGLPVLLFLWKKRHPRITEQIVYCAMAGGVGFSIEESIYYFYTSMENMNDMILLVIRTLTTTLMHGMSTAVIGVGMLILHKQRNILMPVIFSLFALSVSIHSLFNLLLPTKLAVVAMLIPLLLYFFGLYFLKNMTEEGGTE